MATYPEIESETRISALFEILRCLLDLTSTQLVYSFRLSPNAVSKIPYLANSEFSLNLLFKMYYMANELMSRSSTEYTYQCASKLKALISAEISSR